MSTEALLMRLTGRQHGLLTSAQALAHGLTPDQVRSRVRSGRWIPVLRGVYRLAGAPETYEQRLMPVSLAVEPPRAISHLTAAWLWGLGFPAPYAIDVLTLHGRSVRLAGVRQHRTNVLHATDVAMRAGIAVTSVARTLVDCSAFVPLRRLGWLVDEADRQGKVRLESLRACHGRLDAVPGRRPTAAMRRVLEQRAPGRDPGDSGWEVYVSDTLVAAGLPRPVPQYPVRIGREAFHLDLAYPEPQIDLEYDGWDAHRVYTAYHRDRRRRRLLTAAGWHPVEVTSEADEEEWVGNIRQLLELYARQPG